MGRPLLTIKIGGIIKTDERFDYFCSQWEELSDSDKVNLFNEYCSYTGCEETIYSFDEEFFDTFFEGRAMEAARATFFWRNSELV